MANKVTNKKVQEPKANYGLPKTIGTNLPFGGSYESFYNPIEKELKSSPKSLTKILKEGDKLSTEEIINDLKSKFSENIKSLYLDDRKSTTYVVIVPKSNTYEAKNEFYDYLDHVKEKYSKELIFYFIDEDLTKSITSTKII